jgi:hypothetical protein
MKMMCCRHGKQAKKIKEIKTIKNIEDGSYRKN